MINYQIKQEWGLLACDCYSIVELSISFGLIEENEAEHNTKRDLILDWAWQHLRVSCSFSREESEEKRAIKANCPLMFSCSCRQRGKLLVEVVVARSAFVDPL